MPAAQQDGTGKSHREVFAREGMDAAATVFERVKQVISACRVGVEVGFQRFGGDGTIDRAAIDDDSKLDRQLFVIEHGTVIRKLDLHGGTPG